MNHKKKKNVRAVVTYLATTGRAGAKNTAMVCVVLDEPHQGISTRARSPIQASIDSLIGGGGGGACDEENKQDYLTPKQDWNKNEKPLQKIVVSF